jgi:hypothetical protein
MAMVDTSKASQYRRDNSQTRLGTAKHLKFIHGADHALLAVEFEAPASCTILESICRALDTHHVAIPASAIRLTQQSMFQWFQLCEADGSALLGRRRDEVVQLFVSTLANTSPLQKQHQEGKSS